MTQEDKQLLLKDLCARFPYGVKFSFCDGHGNEVFTLSNLDGILKYDIENECTVRAYLRPLSSMTDGEEESLREDTGFDIFKCTVNKELEDLWTTDCSVKDLFCLYSWLNEHHFDYNGLIEKGLALEAPEEMYKTK